LVDESDINHQDIKKYAWSEKRIKVMGENAELPAIGGRRLSPGSGGKNHGTILLR
jgi:hypothetical protein